MHIKHRDYLKRSFVLDGNWFGEGKIQYRYKWSILEAFSIRLSWTAILVKPGWTRPRFTTPLGPCMCFPATRLPVQSISTNKAKWVVKMRASKLLCILRSRRLFPTFREYRNRWEDPSKYTFYSFGFSPEPRCYYRIRWTSLFLMISSNTLPISTSLSKKR